MKIIHAVVIENGKRVRRTLALEPRLCEVCGAEFEPQRQSSKYCSKKCSKKAEYNKNADRYIERAKNFYYDNLEANRKRRREYYWSNPELFREKTREWNKLNKKEKNERDSKYKDKIRHGGMKEELVNKFGCICQECGKESDTFNIVAHHVTLNNKEHDQQILLCRSCHMRLHQTIHSNLPNLNCVTRC